jgi:hypothetical protein
MDPELDMDLDTFDIELDRSKSPDTKKEVMAKDFDPCALDSFFNIERVNEKMQ